MSTSLKMLFLNLCFMITAWAGRKYILFSIPIVISAFVCPYTSALFEYICCGMWYSWVITISVQQLCLMRTKDRNSAIVISVFQPKYYSYLKLIPRTSNLEFPIARNQNYSFQTSTSIIIFVVTFTERK